MSLSFKGNQARNVLTHKMLSESNTGYLITTDSGYQDQDQVPWNESGLSVEWVRPRATYRTKQSKRYI